MRWRWPFGSGGSEPGSSQAASSLTQADPWANAPLRSDLGRAPEPEASGVTQLLSAIEAAACAVYAAHGLPDRPGQYARSPKSGKWRFLSDDLTVDERWALILAQREGSGWRFGSLPDLGAQADSPPDLQHAAGVLRSCHHLRSRLADGGGIGLGEDLETAIGLGVAWRGLEAAATSKRAGALVLSAPAKPRAKRKSRAKPKARPTSGQTG